MSTFTLGISVCHFQFTLIHGSNIPGSYAILLFTTSALASITSHIHNWVLFLLWLHPFILSGVISPLISISILELPLAQGQGWQLTVPGCESAGAAQRSFPTSEVRGGSYHTPEVRGSSREEQPHLQGVAAALVQEGGEKVLHIQGQEGQL